ncbi:polyamine aminopropyltransferase [Bacillus marasmi]|uniref:polyamine aminopropyltransferase n=1 Tax=Bacillus marasmi TaxID=1926279 RepID=UPI0011CA0720|nr:polyamine aminopropyltransferase [Bacillus marasmi]
MADKKSMSGFKQDDKGVWWISNYVSNAKLRINYKIKKLLDYKQSEYQQISIVDSVAFGKMLVLDGIPQISTGEGFIYNEMISHIPIVTHHNPKKVAMIGGGDCGNAREAMKYAEIEKIHVIEIDPQVTELCQKWLTPAEVYEQDQRFQIFHRDGFEWIQEQQGEYDVLMIDRPDPVGPGKKLFEPEFYQYVYNALSDDGVVVFQSGSPFYNQSILKKTVKQLRTHFPIVRTYLMSIPLYPCGLWSFTLASKRYDPLQANLSKLHYSDTKYICPEMFLASFVLPKYVHDLLEI